MAADSKLTGVLLTGTFGSRPAANTVAGGTLYSDTTNNLIYQSDGSTWTTWATLGGAPAFVELADSLLGADAANIDFTSVSGSYKHLKVLIYARTDAAGTGDAVGLRFNNDTGSNYYFEELIGNDGTPSSTVPAASTFYRASYCPGNGADANLFCATEVVIPNYAGSTNKKHASSYGGYVRTTGPHGISGAWSGLWNNTAAITRVTVLPVGGGANLKSGSRATLYGLN